MQKGYRYFSADVTILENPYKAALGFCVRLKKGDFIGREALLKAKEQGVQQRLCALTIGGEEYLSVYGGEAAYAGGTVLGRLRSCGYGYTVMRNIGYAYLPLHLAQEGTKLEVFGERVPAQVVQDALYDPKGARLRE